MGLLRTIRSTLLDVIEAHERCGGRGRDDYFDEPIVHPMAEGKYLSTLATLHETRLLSADRMRSHADAALERLAATSVATAPDEAAWGLGFHRADTEPDEPFVVTTAIVASGLLDLPDGLGADMATAACTWLDRVAPRTNVEVDGGRASLHLYSPSMPVLIVNAVAVAAAVLARAGLGGDTEPPTRWIVDRHVPGVGWPYADDSPRVDLVHQCYVLNALLELAGPELVEPAAMQVLGRFKDRTSFIDKLTLFPTDDPADEPPDTVLANAASFAHHPGDGWLVRDPDPARDWSVGELLVLLARLQIEGRRRRYWATMLRRTLTVAADRMAVHAEPGDDLSHRPRHAMHLAHGAASAVASLRSSRRAAALAP